MASAFRKAAALGGIALGAGLIGSLAMLLSQKAEMKATGREPSDTPAEAVETLTGADVRDPKAEAALSTATHLAFGTALGLGLPALGRVAEPWRTALFAAGAWGVGTSMLVALDLAEPPTRWTRGQLATDLGHHAVYGMATAAAWSRARRLIAA